MATSTTTAPTLDLPLAEPLDTSAHLITPERVRFDYPLAGPFRRFLAYLVDTVVLLVAMLVAVIVSIVISLGSSAGGGILFAFLFVLIWGYGAFCEGAINGQTVGKRVLGIRVLTVDGVAITGSQAAIRNLVGMLDGIPSFFLAALACMALSPRFRRLGDLAAGTMVVVEERRAATRMVRVDAPGLAEVLTLLPMRLSAGSDLARAVSDYARHRSRFRGELREELASHLAGPLRLRYRLPDVYSSDAVLCAVYHRVFLGE